MYKLLLQCLKLEVFFHGSKMHALCRADYNDTLGMVLCAPPTVPRMLGAGIQTRTKRYRYVSVSVDRHRNRNNAKL